MEKEKSDNDFFKQFEDRMKSFHKIMKSHMSNNALKANMSLPQFTCIFILSKMGKAKMSDLADALTLSYASATNLINKLCDSGYVERYDDPSDRRVVYVELSDKGKEITQSLLNSDRCFINEKTKSYSEEDKKTLLNGLDLMIGLFEGYSNKH